MLVIASAVSLAFGQEVARRVSVDRQIERLTREITSSEQSTRQLDDLIATLKSSTFQEGAARTQLNLQKPGERVLVIPPTNGSLAPDTAGEPTDGSGESARKISNPQRWWQYFFGTVAT